MGSKLNHFKRLYGMEQDGKTLFRAVKDGHFSPEMGPLLNQLLKAIGITDEMGEEEIFERLHEEMLNPNRSVSIALQEAASLKAPFMVVDDLKGDARINAILKYIKERSDSLADRKFGIMLTQLRQEIEKVLYFLNEAEAPITQRKTALEIYKEAFGCAHDGETILVAAERGLLNVRPSQMQLEIKSEGKNSKISLRGFLMLLGIRPEMERGEVLDCLRKGDFLAQYSSFAKAQENIKEILLAAIHFCEDQRDVVK
jgi:hypothetical protein